MDITGSAKIDNHGDQHVDYADHANQGVHSQPISDERASNMIEEFEVLRSRAKEALLLAQVFQCHAYNRGQINCEFEVGDPSFSQTPAQQERTWEETPTVSTSVKY
jgi:hypothetical protein